MFRGKKIATFGDIEKAFYKYITDSSQGSIPFGAISLNRLYLY